jgi:hypothetical protein
LKQRYFNEAQSFPRRLGGRVQEIIQAGKRGEFTQNDDGTITILNETLSDDEAKVVYRGKEGEDVAADHGIVVSMDLTVTEDSCAKTPLLIKVVFCKRFYLQGLQVLV